MWCHLIAGWIHTSTAILSLCTLVVNNKIPNMSLIKIKQNIKRFNNAKN